MAKRVVDEVQELMNPSETVKEVYEALNKKPTSIFEVIESIEENGVTREVRVCNVFGGCIVSVSTAFKNEIGLMSVSENTFFVPGNHAKDGKIIKM